MAKNIVKCPHCGKEHGVIVEACVPDSQKMSIAIAFKGPCVSALTYGGILTNTSDLLKEIASAHKISVDVFIENIQLTEKEIKTDLIILSRKKLRERHG